MAPCPALGYKRVQYPCRLQLAPALGSTGFNTHVNCSCVQHLTTRRLNTHGIAILSSTWLREGAAPRSISISSSIWLQRGSKYQCRVRFDPAHCYKGVSTPISIALCPALGYEGVQYPLRCNSVQHSAARGSIPGSIVTCPAPPEAAPCATPGPLWPGP